MNMNINPASSTDPGCSMVMIVVVILLTLVSCSIFERKEVPYSGAELESSEHSWVDEQTNSCPLGKNYNSDQQSLESRIQ
jgi:hypothetical protein